MLCKLLLSTFALADTEDASSYELYTRFISTLSLRYSSSLRITEEQLYFHTEVDNTFALKHLIKNTLKTRPNVKDVIVLVYHSTF